jgi:Fungal Zn(2)-Cys(6) binuclear cluster domain
MVPLYGLRNSCDLCNSSKLRCSREKPACARCRKNGGICTYSPTKRPGRRRKVATVSGAVQADPSYSTNAESVVAIMEEMRFNQTTSAVSRELPPSTYASSHPLNPAPQWDVSSIVMDDEDFEKFIGVLNSLGPPAMLDMDLSNVDPLATPTNNTILHLPVDDVAHATNEDHWLTLEPIGEGFDIPDHPAAPGSSSQNTDQSSSLPDSSWLPNSAQFSAECISLKRWTSSSRSLLLFNDASEQGLTDMQCLCHIAVANLQFHRKSVCNIQPAVALEACLHLQRLLHWTWSIHKECHSCRDDDLVNFIVAGIANQVVGIYRTIIDSNAKGLHGRARSATHSTNRLSGSRMQTQRSLFDWTSLSFGSKIIHGPAKIAFLRRLVGLKLRQIGCLLEDLLDRKGSELGRELAQPLRLLVSGILGRLNVTAGMLSTLE